MYVIKGVEGSIHLNILFLFILLNALTLKISSKHLTIRKEIGY